MQGGGGQKPRFEQDRQPQQQGRRPDVRDAAAFLLLLVFDSQSNANNMSSCNDQFGASGKNVATFSDAINVVSAKLCMMVLLTKFLPSHATFSILDHISRPQQ